MADFDLLFGVLGGGDISGKSGSEIKRDLDSIINAINQNPYKIQVVLDPDSIRNFRSELDGLTAYAQAQANNIQAAYRSIRFPTIPSGNGGGGHSGGHSGSSSSRGNAENPPGGSNLPGGNNPPNPPVRAYEDAARAVREYYSALKKLATDRNIRTDVHQVDRGNMGVNRTTGNYEWIPKVAYESETGRNENFANTLNRTKTAYDLVVNARDQMFDQDQVRLQRLITEQQQEYNQVLEDQANKERLAADARRSKTENADAIKKEHEEYNKSKKIIEDFYAAKLKYDKAENNDIVIGDDGRFESASGKYKELANELNRTSAAYENLKRSMSFLSDSNQTALNALDLKERNAYNLKLEGRINKKDDSDAAKAEAEAYKKATADLREYYKAKTEALKHRGEVWENEDGSWETNNKNLEAFVKRLNDVTTAYKNSAKAADNLSAKNKALFKSAETKEIQAYDEAVQAQNRKDIDADAAKKEADLKRYAAQVEKVNNLLLKVKKNLADWDAAKTGKSSDSYRGLEQTSYVLEEMARELRDSGHAIDDFDARLDGAAASVKQFAANIKLAGENTKSVKDKLGQLMSTLGISFTFAEVFHKAIEIGQKMVETITEVDTAMTELKKVTDETDSTYTKFLENAKTRAHDLGATLDDTISATADFARLGNDIYDASSLADAAIVYKNVGDGIDDIATASESIISTMQAFGIEAKNAMSIVDSFNAVGNNFAVSSQGIGEALLNSAASLHAAGNDIHESIALIAAANTTIQDPGKVGRITCPAA